MMTDLFKNEKVIVCVGSGGVGKTTVAASLGVLAAHKGLNVLVLTIDPAKRLAQSLGLSKDIESDTRVDSELIVEGELYAGLVDPEKSFDLFVRGSGLDSEGVEKLLNNKLYKQLATTLSGSQEFTSLDRLLTAYESGKYDLIILDTPPAQNAVDFFSAPEKIAALFQESITKWFARSEKTKGLIPKVIGQGTKKVLNAFERVTGAEFIGELADFFTCVHDIQKRISERSLQTNELLKSDKVKFVLVTSFDEVKLKEAKEIYKNLESKGYNMVSIVVNRCLPEWFSTNEDLSGDELESLQVFYENLRVYYSARQSFYGKFEEALSGHLEIVKVPDMSNDTYKLAGLRKLGEIILEEKYVKT